jgi:uncharacterized membrane protein YccC
VTKGLATKGLATKGLAMKFLARWPSMPDAGAVVRSLLGVLVVAGVGLSTVGAAGATAAAGAAAIAGATALRDSPLGRIPLVVGVSVALGVAVLLGAATSAYSVVFAVVVAVWCFWAGMMWAAGSNPGLIATAASALLVISPPIAPTWSAVGGTAALAVAGGVAQAALIAIWPRRRWRIQREALTRAYESLAADARRLAEDPAAPVTEEPLAGLRDAFALTEDQARRRPIAYRAWYRLPERIAVSTRAIARRSMDGDARTRILQAASEVLDAVARPSQIGPAAAAIDRFEAVAAEVAASEPILVGRLSEQLHDAATLRLNEFGPRTNELTHLPRSHFLGVLANTIATARGQLSRESPVLRHAVRLAVAAGCGVAIARFAEVAHGYWIPLTVIMVLRPETAHTYTRCAGRVGGTVVGIAVATVIALMLQPSGMVAATLAVVLLGCAYAASRVGYLAVTASLAAAIVFLIDIAGVDGLGTVSDRVAAALIGGMLAVLAHVLLPDQAAVRLRQRASELLKAEIDYAATVIGASVHDGSDDIVAAAWERAYRARAAFEAAAAVGAMDERHLRRWLRDYRTGLNAVTAACAALEQNLPPHRPTEFSHDLINTVDEYVAALRGDPQTAGSTWTVDVAALMVATDRARAELTGADDAWARILAAEIVTVTDNLVAIAASTPTA